MTDDLETANRRARLKEIIRVLGGRQALLDHIFERTGEKANGGEISALQKPGKSFGDAKARTLTEQIGLHRRWFDAPPGTNLDRSTWLESPSADVGASAKPAATVVAHIRVSEAGLTPHCARLLRLIRELDKDQMMTPELAAALTTLLKPLKATPALLAAESVSGQDKYAGVADPPMQASKPPHPHSGKLREEDAK